MDELYLVLFKEPKTGSITALVPLETLIALYTMGYIKCDCISVKFVLKARGDEIPFEVDIPCSSYETIAEVDAPLTIQNCVLPALVVNSSVGTVCIAGLSAVLRQVTKTVKLYEPSLSSLLGFREGCLSACAESSLWTKFCEVDIPKATKEHILNIETSVDDELILPVDLARFERHMEQPLRIHNIQKQKQEYAKCIVKNIFPNKSFHLHDAVANMAIESNAEELKHRFSESYYLTLADIILFPCIFILFESTKNVKLDDHIPLVKQWFEMMVSLERVKASAKIISIKSIPCSKHRSCSLPMVVNQSLYKSDPKRYKPHTRSFTRQDEVEASLKLVSQMGLSVDWSVKPFGADMECDWSLVPPVAHPLGGNLPISRSMRKQQQLENLVKAVLKVAKPGNTIVDFCSGSGHLGILLAHFLPHCRIVLLDNKDESLRRARDRVNHLALLNVTMYQCNLDYFKGMFDIGVSLHACGVATDLVIQRCLDQEAVFICCPCCYGGVSDNHVVTYPRSMFFKNSPITVREYLVIGHSADQTHDENNSKTEQGKQCMRIIDMDRCMQAKEKGYKVFLSKLIPETCTPKNNLLVGLPETFCL